MMFNEAFVSFDRAFNVAFFFRSLSDLIHLCSIATYFLFFAGRYVLGFLSRLENDRGRCRIRAKANAAISEN